MLKSIPSSLALEILMVSPSLITKKVLGVYLKVHLPMMETSTDHLAYEVVLVKFSRQAESRWGWSRFVGLPRSGVAWRMPSSSEDTNSRTEDHPTTRPRDRAAFVGLGRRSAFGTTHRGEVLLLRHQGPPHHR